VSVKKTFVTSISAICVAWIILYNSYHDSDQEAYISTIVQARKCYDLGFIYRAIEMSTRAIALSPHKTEPYFIKIRCFIQMLDFDEALNLLKKVEKLCTTKYEENVYDSLVILYSEKEKLYNYYLQTFDNAKLIKPFLNSMYKNDVQILHNDIFYNDYGVRGICATRDLGVGDEIVAVPENMIVSAVKSRKLLAQKYAKEEKKSQEDIKKILMELYKKNTFALGLYILEHQNESRFKPFVDMINSNDYTSFPLRFDSKTLDLLRGTDLEKKYISLKEALDHDFSLLYKIDSIKKKYDINTLQNLYLAVSSRNFGWSFAGYHDMLIVPYIDMCNHSSNPNTRWYYDEQKNCFCLIATKTIQQGCEIFDTYGASKSNTQLLLAYGFCLDDNEDNDEVILEYPLYRKNGSDTIFLGNKEYVCRKNTNTVKNNFSTFLNHIMEEILNDNKNIPLIDAARKTMDIVNKLAKKKLDSYPGTLQEDKNILESKSALLTFNERNCYLVRVSEKNVLQWIIDFTEYCIQLLSQCLSVDDLKVFFVNSEINNEVKRFFTKSKFFSDLLKDIK
jgi:hypothetical protein